MEMQSLRINESRNSTRRVWDAGVTSSERISSDSFPLVRRIASIDLIVRIGMLLSILSTPVTFAKLLNLLDLYYLQRMTLTRFGALLSRKWLHISTFTRANGILSRPFVISGNEVRGIDDITAAIAIRCVVNEYDSSINKIIMPLFHPIRICRRRNMIESEYSAAKTNSNFPALHRLIDCVQSKRFSI